jgi:drug/metabolite transporter (DMT)-like permease
MNGWLIATLAAALLQTTRTALQQRLRGLLSTNAAGFVRYAFGAPFSVAAVAVLVALGNTLPGLSIGFLWRVALAGFAQIMGTFFLITAFAKRDFAIGTVYSKTEAVQVALISSVVLGEGLHRVAWVGIAVLMVGVAVLAAKGDITRLKRLLSGKADLAMWAGIGAGTGFAVAATFIRAASRTLGEGQPIVRALVTLAVMNLMQVVMNGSWMMARRRGEFAAIAREWKSSVLVGFLSVAGSAGWAIGMTLHNAAVVRAVGQIDVVFAFLVGTLIFSEKRRQSEYVGTLFVIAGVVLVTLAA